MIIIFHSIAARTSHCNLSFLTARRARAVNEPVSELTLDACFDFAVTPTVGLRGVSGVTGNSMLEQSVKYECSLPVAYAGTGVVFKLKLASRACRTAAAEYGELSDANDDSLELLFSDIGMNGRTSSYGPGPSSGGVFCASRRAKKALAILGELPVKKTGFCGSSGVLSPLFSKRRSFWYFGVLNFLSSFGELNSRNELDLVTGRLLVVEVALVVVLSGGEGAIVCAVESRPGSLGCTMRDRGSGGDGAGRRRAAG